MKPKRITLCFSCFDQIKDNIRLKQINQIIEENKCDMCGKMRKCVNLIAGYTDDDSVPDCIDT